MATAPVHTLLGCAAVSAGPVPSPGEGPALEGRCSSTHHTLWWGPAADPDPHGARAPRPLTQDLRQKPPGFCGEVSARAAGWLSSLTSFLYCHIFSFVCRLGILTVRHLKRLERVILGYLEVYDGPEEEARLKILETLKLLMQYTWPRYNSQQTCVVRGWNSDFLVRTCPDVHAVPSVKDMPLIPLIPIELRKCHLKDKLYPLLLQVYLSRLIRHVQFKRPCRSASKGQA